MSEKALHTVWPPPSGVLYRRDISILHTRDFVCLVDLFLASGLRAENPFGLAVNIGFVLDRNAAEMAEDVLHLGIGVAASGTAHVVDCLQTHEDVVDHGDDNDDTNRIAPDNHNGND